MDANGNEYGPFDIEVPGSQAESFTEANWHDLDRSSGVVEGFGLTFDGRTAQLAPGYARVRGSWLRRRTLWTHQSTATTTAAPRRDMLVLRRTLTTGEGAGAVPGAAVPLVLPGNPAATPTDPTYNPATDEPLWSWQVPGNGGSTILDIRDLRRTVLPGGHWSVAGQHGLAAIAASDGMRVLDRSTGRDLLRRSGAWVKQGGPIETLVGSGSFGNSGLAPGAATSNLVSTTFGSPVAADTCSIHYVAAVIAGAGPGTPGTINLRVNGITLTQQYMVAYATTPTIVPIHADISIPAGASSFVVDLALQAGDACSLAYSSLRITI